jgi:hypothetical protein
MFGRQHHALIALLTVTSLSGCSSDAGLDVLPDSALAGGSGGSGTGGAGGGTTKPFSTDGSARLGSGGSSTTASSVDGSPGVGGLGTPDANVTAGGGAGGGIPGVGGSADSGFRDAPASAGGSDGPRSTTDGAALDGPNPTGGNLGLDAPAVDPCSPPPPAEHHTIHFRYPWAGQRTLTLFPKPAFMPKSIDLELKASGNTTTVSCTREQDRPWFACPAPDAFFTASTTWRAVDKSHAPEWTTVAPRPFPSTPKEYWLRWIYGRPDLPRNQDPANFEFLDHYPDAAYGDWSATGSWNDASCASSSSSPVSIGFGKGAWFPYKRTQHKYPYGTSLTYVYPEANRAKAQDAIDAFVFERYNLWKKNWVRYDADACGTGTARVYSDNPQGTVSEGQGYGMAISAAIGDKELFDKLWAFTRHFLSDSRYCGLMGWIWNDASDCQVLDLPCDRSMASCTDSAFDGDVDIGIGLLYAAMQWPEYTDAATAWLIKMECEVNAAYGDGFNYPTVGDSWDKADCTADTCTFAPKTDNTVYVDYLPPGYFRAFGDFLAAKLGAEAKADNGQSHHDFWYKTAETVWELVERCYDAKDVHPALMGNQGHITAPCSAGGGEPYEWGRALWRLSIDAAWFGNNADLPENQASASLHYAPKSRMQAKVDLIQDFYSAFYRNNPPEPNANRFSTLCHQLGTDGKVTNCDPAYGHNAYTVTVPMSAFVPLFDDDGKTTSDVRQEALEESLSTTVQNQHYFEESLGVYAILFLTGNFPNPMAVPPN